MYLNSDLNITAALINFTNSSSYFQRAVANLAIKKLSAAGAEFNINVSKKHGNIFLFLVSENEDTAIRIRVRPVGDLSVLSRRVGRRVSSASENKRLARHLATNE